jgi:hypothetical protein
VVQARRAKVRPARVIIPLVIAAALLVGGSFAAVKFWPNATTAGPQPESSATTESQSPTTAESSPSPSTTASSTTKPANAAAVKALEACQKKVHAADVVLKQGKIGVMHWVGHVQAQKDNLAGKATVDQMKGRFKATRLKGPGDLKRYDDAVSTFEDLKGSCVKVKGAESAVARTLAKCEKRSKAQQPVMMATAAGMKDWKNHQKFMQRNALHKEGSPSDAQTAWMKQYNAAPKNINAFKKAVRNFDPPSC